MSAFFYTAPNSVFHDSHVFFSVACSKFRFSGSKSNILLLQKLLLSVFRPLHPCLRQQWVYLLSGPCIVGADMRLLWKPKIVIGYRLIIFTSFWWTAMYKAQYDIYIILHIRNYFRNAWLFLKGPWSQLKSYVRVKVQCMTSKIVYQQQCPTYQEIKVNARDRMRHCRVFTKWSRWRQINWLLLISSNWSSCTK